MELPDFPHVKVFSKKERDTGYARNGIHEPNIEKIELTLYVWEHPFIVRECYDCKEVNIKKGDLIGTVDMIRARCVNCMEIPDGLQAWEVVFKMKRKTRIHPKGLLKLRKVQTPAILRDYFDQVGKIYQMITERVIWTSAQLTKE